MKGLDFNNLPQDPKTSQRLIDRTFENNIKDKEIGILGKLFGFGDSVKFNIAGISILILILAGISYTIIVIFCEVNEQKVISIGDFWAIITPLLTLTLGYIFGKSDK